MYKLVALLTSLIALLTAIVGLFVPDEKEESTYALTTQVVQLDYENDLVVCEDFNGNLWEFSGCEDWMYGDIASLVMNDMGTPSIYDDEIISARYSGYFDGFARG